MGCLKLAYKNSGTLLKVAYRKPFLEEKSVQRFTTIDPVFKEYESSYAAFANNPVWFVDPTGLDTFKVNHSGKMQRLLGGSKEVYSYTDKKGKDHSLGSFTKNSNGYIQLNNFDYKDGYLDFGFNVKPGAQAFISPTALGSLFGTLAENNINDLTITGASTSTGGSPSPSKSHVLGVALDLRYLRKDKTGESVNIWESQVDFRRNNDLIESFQRFGFTKFLSEHSNYKIDVQTTTPFFALLQKQTHILINTTHYTKARHYHHLHVGGKYGGVIQYNPQVQIIDNRKKKSGN